MTSNYKIGGVWKQATPYVNVGGTWKVAKSAWIYLSSEWKSWFLQGGLNDGGFTTFDVYNGFDSTINSIAIQTDGKIVLGGQFTIFNGVTVNRIVRLNSDGTRDTTFTTNTGTSANNIINSIAIQTDGKIVLCGQFTTFNGVTVNRIVRLNTDGTRDTLFTTNTGTGADGAIMASAIQTDGKIVLGGSFGSFNGVTVMRIVRLNSDGTRDTTFTTNTGTGAGGAMWSIAVQSDGKIVLGGSFTTFNGVTANGIVRLNSDGTRDTTFTTNTGTGTNDVLAVAVQSDGKIVLGGVFTTFNGVTVNRIVRLNSDGTRDTTFTTNTGTGATTTTINSIAIQTDGKIVLGGQFTIFNGATVNRIVRLNSDGTRDTTFTTNTGTGAEGTNSIINSIAIQTDGKIVLGGQFSGFNQINRTNLARIGGDISQ